MKRAQIACQWEPRSLGSRARILRIGMSRHARKVALLLFSATGCAIVLAPVRLAHADEYHHEGHEEAREHREAVERHEFHERDVHRFTAEELGHWRGGYWKNSCFGGRCGWWWFAGGRWYFYERPVYPYPLVVSEVAFVEPVPPPTVYVVPPAVTVAPAAPPIYAAPPPAPPVYAAPPAPAAAPPPAQMYYYCDNPPGYYPSVPGCPSGFRAVPAPAR